MTETQVTPYDPTGVHRAHCCARHGCKYRDVACPVKLVQVKQEHPCEFCGSLDDLMTAIEKAQDELRWLNTLMNVRPPDMTCGSCGQRLVPTQGGWFLGKIRDPEMWVENYTHAGPMMDRHGAYPVDPWEEE